MIRNQESLRRLLRPRSVALVGATDRQPRSNNAWSYLRHSDVRTYLVTPSRTELYGQPTYPSLSEIGEAVDAAFVMVNANATMRIVEEARDLGVGGLVLNAGGFAENGAEGADQQRLLVDLAGPDLALLGPNCNGYIDPDRGVRLSGAPPLPIRGGSIGVASHTGAVMSALGVTGYERRIGFSQMISTGNEAALDMADCVDFLADDDRTRVICLIVESIRRPREFFAAVDKAIARGKPVLALKLGRSARSRQIAASHTGSVAGEAWIYDAAFRQHGIMLATDLADLMDRAICFDQLPTERWSPVQGLAVLTASGGGSALAADSFAESGTDLPELANVLSDVRRVIPTATVANPLDMTGFVIGNADMADRILHAYSSSEQVDTLVLQWFLDDAAQELGAAFLNKFVELADKTPQTLMVSSLEDTTIGTFAASLPEEGVAVGRGLATSVRALETMGEFVRAHRRRQAPADERTTQIEEIPSPSRADVVDAEVGPILSFAAGMQLLASHGIRIAPYLLVGVDHEQEVVPSFAGPYVVKLANVAHRTEIGAVEVGVDVDAIPDAVHRMRKIAEAHDRDATVVVQAMLPSTGEAFVGIQNETALGSMVLCGIGGTLVELLRKVVGLHAPFSRTDADRMLEDLADAHVFEGWRGQPGWDRQALIDAVMAMQRLGHSSARWLGSLDVNPMLVQADGFVAVDCLAVLRDPGASA